MIIEKEIRHFHLFCGLGGGAKGFNQGQARVGNLKAKFRCIGGIDVAAPAIRDFERLTGARGTVLDLFDRSQFRGFHGVEPPAGWREATPDDIRHAAGNERPHIVFLSAPCKGFSGLLAEKKSKSVKYIALNRLTLRGVWLMLEAWKDDPPELIVFENVPRIAIRGRQLLDQICDLLRAYGYAVAETAHDCGELGALAQSRKRFLLVARHIEKVPPFLYEPEKKRLQAVGTVLDRMPLPGDPTGGPMHRVPRLQWKTWVRLAFVEAGSDWRSLNRLAVENGHLQDYLIVPGDLPSSGAFSVADPWFKGHEYQQYGVRRWDESTGAVSGQSAVGGGPYSVADPRVDGVRHNNVFRIVAFGDHAQAVTAGGHPTAGGQAVADPRGATDPATLHGKYKVESWNQPARTVIAGNANGASAVADPRPANIPQKGDHYLTGGHYGVTRWGDPSGAVSAAACHDNGRWSVADPRNLPECSACTKSQTVMPASADRLVAMIRSLDGTWHRPFTTLELAALQSLVEPEEQLELDGLSDSAWRERIGNAVPPAAAEAIAGVMGTTLLLAWSGETFVLSSTPIWVRPVAMALSLPESAC